MKELIVLERENGWYGGYEKRNNKYAQVFNSDKRELFSSIKYYTDKGYTVRCFDKTQEREFMKERKTFDEYIREMRICTATNAVKP